MPQPCDVDADQALIQSLAAGDPDALREVVRRHERWVRGVVFSVLGSVDEVEDVVQQVWLAVWKACGRLEDTRKWRHWLYRLARNAAIDAGRRRTRRRRLRHRLTDAFRTGRAAPAQPDRKMIVREEHRRVLDAVGRIPEIYREVFVLRHVDEMSYRRIAEVVGTTPATVGTRLARARKMLLSKLQTGRNDD